MSRVSKGFISSKSATAGEVQAKMEGHVRDALAVLIRGLRAEETYVTKRGEAVSKPDFHERRQAAALILAYVVGEPVKRAVNANVDAGHMDLADLEAKAKESPALQDAMRRVIGASGGVVEIEARESDKSEGSDRTDETDETDELSRLRVPGEGNQQTGGDSGALPSEKQGSK
ncbi:MAG: hypothetical protein ACOYMV_08075 [Verrucomicrobiia bacterium]